MNHSIYTAGQVKEIRETGSSTEEWAEGIRKTTGLAEAVSLELADGSVYALDREDARLTFWLDLLTRRREFELPVYVEAEVETRVVRELYSSFPYHVRSVNPKPVEGRLRIILRESHAVFYLNPALPRFAELRAKLEAAAGSGAELLVASHPLTFEILDAREPTGPEDAGSGNFKRDDEDPAAAGTAAEFLRSSVTLDQAFEAFNFLARSDIPFDCVIDCCMARAQKMCRLLREQFGIRARKLWNFGHGYPASGTLFFIHPDDPETEFQWYYHVAPIVSVVDAAVSTLVFDPGMFRRPVSVETWLAEQNDSDSDQYRTNDNIYGYEPIYQNHDFNTNPARVERQLRHHAGKCAERKFFQNLLLRPAGPGDFVPPTPL